jgi:hypothetical protein
LTENQAQDHEYKTHSSDTENSGCAQSRRKAFQEVSHLSLFSRSILRRIVGVLNVSGMTDLKCTRYNRSHDAVIRVFDAAGNVIETHEHAGEFKE